MPGVFRRLIDDVISLTFVWRFLLDHKGSQVRSSPVLGLPLSLQLPSAWQVAYCQQEWKTMMVKAGETGLCGEVKGVEFEQQSNWGEQKRRMCIGKPHTHKKRRMWCKYKSLCPKQVFVCVLRKHSSGDPFQDLVSACACESLEFIHSLMQVHRSLGHLAIHHCCGWGSETWGEMMHILPGNPVLVQN